MSEENYPLHSAVLGGATNDVSRLIAEGHDLDTLDTHGMAPLHWAVYGGYQQIVELLLKAGANVNARTSEGTTSLWHAEDDFGLIEIADILRMYGAEK